MTTSASISIPGFDLQNLIAEGGCAEIYRGIQTSTNREVAIKILHPKHSGNQVEFKRLLKEGALGMRLRRGPGVVQMMQVGKANGCPYIVMEYIPGGTLREMVYVQKRLRHSEVLGLALTLAKCLRFVHNEGIYHKDIKPDNIMRDAEGHWKLIDFGFAETRATIFFGIFGRRLEGSPRYMAPELIQTKKPSAATDLYSLGCALYEAAAGRPPFEGSGDSEVLSKQVNHALKAVPVQDLNKEIGFATGSMIQKLLEKDPAQRTKSADELLLELARNPDSRR